MNHVDGESSVSGATSIMAAICLGHQRLGIFHISVDNLKEQEIEYSPECQYVALVFSSAVPQLTSVKTEILKQEDV